MLQILLIVALTLEIALYIFLGVYWWDGIGSLFMIAPLIIGLAVMVRILFVLPSYGLSAVLRFRNNNRQPWGNSFYALDKELDARVVAFGWSEAFHPWVMPERISNAISRIDPTPILLVHGYLSNRGIFWQLRKRLFAADLGPIYALNLEPLMGSIDNMVPTLAEHIEKICSETNAAQITVVAHSMGGLVTRRYMSLQANGGFRIKRFITLGSPHHGTEMARFSVGKCVAEMRTASAWLSALESAEVATEKPPTLSIYTLNDDLVYPPESSKLYWAENVPMAAVGHISLLFSKPVAERVIAEIKK